MLVLLHQLRSGDPVLINTRSIKDCYPEVVGEGDEEMSGTLVVRFNEKEDEGWIVRETCREIYDLVNGIERGDL